MPRRGFEPPASALGTQRSLRLSYRGKTNSEGGGIRTRDLRRDSPALWTSSATPPGASSSGESGIRTHEALARLRFSKALPVPAGGPLQTAVRECESAKVKKEEAAR